MPQKPDSDSAGSAVAGLLKAQGICVQRRRVQGPVLPSADLQLLLRFSETWSLSRYRGTRLFAVIGTHTVSACFPLYSQDHLSYQPSSRKLSLLYPPGP